MAEHDPTAAEVAAAIATLQAFEHAREVATESPVLPAPAVAVEVHAAVVSERSPAKIDPYLARSVKSSQHRLLSLLLIRERVRPERIVSKSCRLTTEFWHQFPT